MHRTRFSRPSTTLLLPSLVMFSTSSQPSSWQTTLLSLSVHSSPHTDSFLPFLLTCTAPKHLPVLSSPLLSKSKIWMLSVQYRKKAVFYPVVLYFYLISGPTSSCSYRYSDLRFFHVKQGRADILGFCSI